MATQENCGSTNVYCPAGASYPTPVTEGYYSGPLESSTVNRYEQHVCEAGYYCVSGVRWNCGSKALYCPQQSTHPLVVDEGYYSAPLTDAVTNRKEQVICTPGHYCTAGSMYNCTAGNYGSTTGLTTGECSGKCNQGYYCMEGSTTPTQQKCGGIEWYCPKGSAHPIRVTKSYYTAPLTVDQDLRYEQRICDAGYYCINGTRTECGGRNYYCPEGSVERREVPKGYVSGPDESSEMTRYEINYCPAGFYCVNGGKNECGVNKYCPEGSSSPKDVPEGYIAGPEVAIDTQKSLIMNCTEGYYCSGGAMMDCGVGFYCPAGSSDPIPVPFGYFTLPNDVPLFLRFAISICPLGSYCLSGVRSLCPAGFFGDSYGLSSMNCSGLCLHGYLCPLGTVSPRSHDCGNSSVYCPTGSYVPTPVSPGYYSGPIYVDPRNRFQQWICPVGHYCSDGESRLCDGGHFGNSTGLSSSSCTGSCRSGYFCPPGSVSDTENECGGVDRYCPPGSDSPSYVPDGFVSGPSYVNETIRSTIESCPLGFYCTGGESRPCSAGSFGNSTVLTSPSCSGLCPIGFYCSEGTSQPDSYPCPSGRYGSELGLFNSSCSGSCSPGFYCPLGSTNSTFIRCGDASVYCPEGSSSPVPVPDGWCSGPLSSSASTRSEVFFPDSYHICVNGT